MIVSSIHFTFDPKDTGIAEESLRELRDASRKEAGVIQFDVGRSSDNPNVFALWEVYADQKAFDAHRSSEHFQRIYVNGIKSLVREGDITHVIPI